MYNIYNTISDMDIPNGTTKRMNCPVCNGYNTFTVTNNMGSLVWNCYKASCTVSGGTRVHLSVEDIRSGFAGAEQFATETFSLPEYIVPATFDVAEWAMELYGIDDKAVGLMYDVKEHRAVFPIKHEGRIVDATGRALGKKLPKWRRYGKSGLPYSHGCGKVAVVVEDCVSAAVVGSYVRLVGVAMLGTSMLDSHKRYLSQFSTAVIALDPDALPKTLAIAKELRGYVSDVRVLRLIDDIKYRNPDDMAALEGIAATTNKEN